MHGNRIARPVIAEIVQWLDQGQVCRLQEGLERCKQVYNETIDRYTSCSLVSFLDRGWLRGYCTIVTPSPQLLSLPLEGFFVLIYSDYGVKQSREERKVLTPQQSFPSCYLCVSRPQFCVPFSPMQFSLGRWCIAHTLKDTNEHE